jgi:hypothetical protein
MTLETPIFLQAGSYSARALRRVVDATLNLGVVEEDDLLVAQRGAGANMTVDVAPGLVVVPAASASNGRYLCSNTATVSLTIGAAPGAGDGRIDLVVAKVRDAQYSGSDNDWQLLVVAGTADPSPVAPSTPAGSIALATVEVTDATTSVVDADITDLRPAARPVVSTDRDPASFSGPDGQIVVREIASAPDRVFVRSSGGVIEFVPRSAAAFVEATLPIQNLTDTEATWDVPVEANAPGAGNYAVLVRHTGIILSADHPPVERFIEISDDGGSTWAYRSDDLGSSGDTTEARFEKLVTDPTGTIQARVRINDTGAGGIHGQAGANGSLSLLVIPVS